MHYCSVVVYVCTTSHPWPNYYVSFRWKMTKWTKISFRCYFSRQARGQLHLFLEKIFLCSCDSDLTKVRPNTEHIHCKLVWLVKTKHTSTIELWKSLREVSQFPEKALMNYLCRQVYQFHVYLLYLNAHSVLIDS